MHSQLKDLFYDYDIPTENSIVSVDMNSEEYIVRYEISFEEFISNITDKSLVFLIKYDMKTIVKLLKTWSKNYIKLISVECSDEEILFNKSNLCKFGWIYIEEYENDYENFENDSGYNLDEDCIGFEEDEEDW